MTPINNHVDSIRKEIQEKTDELNRIERLIDLYPDLQIHVGRWKKVVFCSKQVNAKVVQYESRHNCGCCNDSPLEIWPYVETEFGKVYSNPTGFFVGENSYYGDIPSGGWEKELSDAGISDEIIEKVQAHFDHQRETALETINDAYSVADEESDE
jgi:hypothetical protein